MILSSVTMKVLVAFLTGRSNYMEQCRMIGEYWSRQNAVAPRVFFKSMKHIYDNALDYVRSPTGTASGLKKKLEAGEIKNSETGTNNPFSASVAVEDILAFLKDGKGLLPNMDEFGQLPDFFEGIRSKREEEQRKRLEAERKRLHDEEIRKAEERKVEEQKAKLREAGLDPEKMLPFAAGPGQTEKGPKG